MGKLQKLNKGKGREVDGVPPSLAPVIASTSSSLHQADATAMDVDENGDAPPPPYSSLEINTSELSSSATVDPADGRITLKLNAAKSFFQRIPSFSSADSNVPEFCVDKLNPEKVPRLEIVIFIVGSRGDIQPFLPLGLTLKSQGHRVRLATHPTFATFVRDTGLEFYSIGGDPAQLMEYMVSNPGLLPDMSSVMKGEIKKKRQMIKEIMEGCWSACSEPGEVTGEPFAADAIISNPPSFAHIHCAEVLNIPLHIVFTMPWYSTHQFTHPLVKFSSSNASSSTSNFLSYSMVDHLTWSGLGDVINLFRRKTLGLETLNIQSGPMILERLKIPHTFIWSAKLIPKPKDWGKHIDITGFNFIELGSNFVPDEELKGFLEAGEMPVFIGFGSVPVPDPQLMTQTILSAIASSGVRVLLSIGWGGLGNGMELPPNVFLLKPCPHDWLFDHVKAVVHHGGAGTTAIGLKKGKATLVVPFFGDQPFWGQMIEDSGAGLMIPSKKLNVENLSEALTKLVSPNMQACAQELGAKMLEEDGAQDSAKSFTRHLPLLNMRCDLAPEQVAVWWSSDELLRLSAFAAAVLAEEKKISFDKLTLHKSKTYLTRAKIPDPLSGAVRATGRLLYDFHYGLGEIFVAPAQGAIRHVTAIPYAMGNYVGSISEGLRNTPALYGGQVRSVGEAKTFTAGLKAGGKGLLWGISDAVTGLVTEPIAGSKREGTAGFFKGMGRSWCDLILKPAAGGLGLVELPARGFVRSLRRKLGSVQVSEALRMATRVHQGEEALAHSSYEDRKAILMAWEEALADKKDRKRRIENELKWWQKAFQTQGWEVEKEDPEAVAQALRAEEEFETDTPQGSGSKTPVLQ